jgi:hypothetical protein
MKALIACEESQAVTKAFRARGHEAYSCDLLDCSGGHPEWHIKGDAVKALHSRSWDLVIAHPPCTRLANSGVRWLASRSPKKGYGWNSKYGVYLNIDYRIWNALREGAAFFNKFVEYGKNGGVICIENPTQHRYAKELILCEWDQQIQPYQFGHTEKKATFLWLFGLPELQPTNNVYTEMMALPYAERSKVHYASPGPERARLRSKTYTGIAEAMAEQWGNIETLKLAI